MDSGLVPVSVVIGAVWIGGVMYSAWPSVEVYNFRCAICHPKLIASALSIHFTPYWCATERISWKIQRNVPLREWLYWLETQTPNDFESGMKTEILLRKKWPFTRLRATKNVITWSSCTLHANIARVAESESKFWLNLCDSSQRFTSLIHLNFMTRIKKKNFFPFYENIIA